MHDMDRDIDYLIRLMEAHRPLLFPVGMEETEKDNRINRAKEIILQQISSESPTFSDEKKI